MSSRYQWRWLLAFWCVHVIGVAIVGVSFWYAPWWWAVPMVIAAWLAGFWAAVLVEIGTQ